MSGNLRGSLGQACGQNACWTRHCLTVLLPKAKERKRRGSSVFGWVNRTACCSVSRVEIHSAGAEPPALPEITASSILERFIAGFVQIVQGRGSLHIGAARFRRYVALQFLHQHLAAATQNIPELPQRATAIEGSTAILQTHTDAR